MLAKTLVIGANGFIGSHLVDALSLDGHEVTAFDRFRSDRANLFASDARPLAGDFLSRSDIERAVSGQDYVFHFLSTTTPATAENDPTFDLRTNVAQTVELLEACVAASVKHFYFASTGGAIYGSQGQSQYFETDRALPISPYGIGKLTIENYLSYFKAKHGLHSTIFRISNPYGGRQRANRKQGLIPIALRQIALGEPVVRLGDGQMVRDYIYVDDLVSMIARVVGKSPEHTVYNLGSGHGHTVAEVLESLHRVTGKDFDIVEQPKPPTFVDRVVLDTSRYVGEFGPHDLTPLDEGISRTYGDILEQLRRELDAAANNYKLSSVRQPH
ncbi:NAD-dependent epimerase/dehydratase family protein [Pseudarthrobacter sp. WHRI 8279]|uniref:NAD-dependent epimerase/dehydratase family protein n=1 Tax=Pseudarthrobacter sp. WHRI 8279 TaxID=3162566 RepID=UPI0035A8B829